VAINWKLLEENASNLTSLRQEGQNKNEFVIYSGLKVSLSTLNGYFPPDDNGQGISVYVDTLVLDAPRFNAKGISIIARNVDTSLFTVKGKATPMVLKPASNCFILAGQLTGGEWLFNTEENPKDAIPVPSGVGAMKPILFSVDNQGVLSKQNMTLQAALPNSLGCPGALNSLKASFISACILLENSPIEKANSEQTNLARQMLEWVVVSCEQIVSLGKLTQPPSYEPSFEQLLIQAKALFVSLPGRNGVYYAPPLAPDYYKNKITGLINCLATYEEQLQTLKTRTDIKQAVEEMSTTLSKNANDVSVAYQVQIDGITENLKTLLSGINNLQRQYYSQLAAAKAAWAKLEYSIDKANIMAYLKACFDIAQAAVKIGIAANPEKPDPGAIVTGVIAGIQAGITAVDLAQKAGTPSGSLELINATTELLEQQNEMTIASWSSYQLWQSAQGNTAIEIPNAAGVSAVDPRLVWQNYLIAADAEIKNLQRDYPEQASNAEDYLASLKILAQFAMGVDSNLVAYTAQLSEGIALLARIKANKNIEQEWQNLSNKSKTEEELLLSMQGLIDTQATSIQRSIYASYRLYVSAYFYRNFKMPPEVVSVTMDSASLTKAFSGISSWTIDAAEKKVNLPVDGATFKLAFPIVKAGDIISTQSNCAVLTPANGKTPASLSFGFPMSSSSELETIIGHGGKLAIWIKEVEAVIEGAVPNKSDNIIFTLSTSGAYVNGFGPEKSYGFVNAGINGQYAYNAKTNQGYIPWKVPELVYSKPTPYTTWEIVMDENGGDIENATSVSLNLNVALMQDPEC
jgi:hypothetical protein